MLSQKQYRNFPYIFGILSILIYILFCAGFTKERWFHTDPAFTLFRILNEDPLFYDRWGNAAQTAPAQTLAHWHAPVSVVLQTINLTLPLLVFLGFIVLRRLEKPAWMLALVLISQGAEAFFIGYNELLPACLWIALAFSLADLKGTYRFAAGIASIIACISHPQAILFLPILIVYTNTKKSDPKLALTLAFCAILFIAKPLIFATNDYDSGLLSRLLSAHQISGVFSSNAWHYFKSAVGTWMLLPSLVSIAVVIYLLFHKYFFRAAFVLFYAMGFAFILLSIYSNGDAFAVMEKYFHAWACACLFSIFLLPDNFNPRLLWTGLIALSTMLFSLRVFHTAPLYQLKLMQVSNLVAHYQTLHQQKVLIPQAWAESHMTGSVWAMPYEGMLLCALQSPQIPQVNIKPVRDNLRDKEKMKAFADSTYGTAEFLPPLTLKSLNPHYFKLPYGPYFIDSMPQIQALPALTQ